MGTINEKKVALNKAFTYVFPMLGHGSIRSFPFIVNCYIGDKDKPEHMDKILLLYSLVHANRYESIVEGLQDLRIFIEEYPVNDNTMMMVFKVPDIHEKNFKFFKAGKYSYMDAEYKVHILDFFDDPRYDLTRIKQVLFRDKELKAKLETELGCEIPSNLDLSDPPDTEREVFNKYIHL